MLGFCKKVATVQPEKVEAGFHAIGMRHGQEEVPVEAEGVVVSDGGRLVAFCETMHRWRKTAQPQMSGDDQPLPETVNVRYACKVPKIDRRTFRIRGMASANGALTLEVREFIPMV